MAQEFGIVLVTQRGVRLLTANGDDLTDTTDPSRKMMRQVAGVRNDIYQVLSVVLVVNWLRRGLVPQLRRDARRGTC